MSNSGYTLIELIVVVAVIAVLSVVSYTYYQDSAAAAQINVVKQNLSLVRDALSRYYQTNLQYPLDLHSLTPAYLQQPVEELLVRPLGSASIEVQIPVPPSPNINPLQHTGAFQWFPAGDASGKGQIRAIRVKYSDGFYLE